MKKLFISIIIFSVAYSANACPICGCGVGGFYIGLLPTYKSKFIGVRYQYAHYETRLADQPDQFSHDYYHIVELYGGLTFGGHWQVMGFVPYHFNHQVTDDGVEDKNGLGDMSVLINYKIWQSTKLTKNNKAFSQELWLGAGAKLPTGKYGVNFSDSTNTELDDLLGDVNSQMGTGSLDFIANAMYNIHINKFGINTTVNYKINTANSSSFRYGDRFAANVFGYYEAKVSKSVYMAPNVGMMYEHVSQNRLADSKVNETGGYASLASLGLDINFKKITVGTNVQLPAFQRYSLGQTKYKTRGLVHVTYTF
ncbi:MAG TPA: hypothetical protein VHB70_15060 [Parafilimonas sp.]|nr:hypothetical protein [Parafilimonas sp.]